MPAPWIHGAEARALRRLQSKSHPLLDALYKLNFIRTVEPAASQPTPAGNSPFCVNPPDAPSTTTPPAGTTPSGPSVSDQPPPLPLPPITPVPPSFEPSPPDNSNPGGQGDQGSPPDNGDPGGQGGQGSSPDNSNPGGQGNPPGSTTPNPPEVGTNPPEVGTNPPQVGTNPPKVGTSPPVGTVPPSPIAVVPSPPEPGGPFQPPIVYPPPLAPPMQPGAGQPLWCVAKPTVPDPIIQEAMDYACGTGAECGSIQPSGACYQPNTVLAHASVAFNSYWQQSKAAGGTCDFGGTATIVTMDPSKHRSLHCVCV
jgi:hypothetical protein